jgi:hypothetical protein
LPKDISPPDGAKPLRKQISWQDSQWLVGHIYIIK